MRWLKEVHLIADVIKSMLDTLIFLIYIGYHQITAFAGLQAEGIKVLAGEQTGNGTACGVLQSLVLKTQLFNAIDS